MYYIFFLSQTLVLWPLPDRVHLEYPAIVPIPVEWVLPLVAEHRHRAQIEAAIAVVDVVLAVKAQLGEAPAEAPAVA